MSLLVLVYGLWSGRLLVVFLAIIEVTISGVICLMSDEVERKIKAAKHPDLLEFAAEREREAALAELTKETVARVRQSEKEYEEFLKEYPDAKAWDRLPASVRRRFDF
jgi:hypothetical protein